MFVNDGRGKSALDGVGLKVVCKHQFSVSESGKLTLSMISVLTQMLVKVVGITLMSVWVMVFVRISDIVSVLVKILDSTTTLVAVRVTGNVSVLVT